MTKDHKAFAVHPSLPFRMLNKNELAKLLGCTVRTIDRMISTGRVPYIEFQTRQKSGRRIIKFDSRDIEKWIIEHRRGASNEAPGEST